MLWFLVTILGLSHLGYAFQLHTQRRRIDALEISLRTMRRAVTLLAPTGRYEGGDPYVINALRRAANEPDGQTHPFED